MSASENGTAIVIEGEASDSDEDDASHSSETQNSSPTDVPDSNTEVITTIETNVALPRSLDTDETNKDVLSPSEEQSSTPTTLSNLIGPVYNSILHKKLREANFRWWRAINEEHDGLCRGVSSTMKRVCNRLDKTQGLAVTTSNSIRSSILSLQNSLVNINQITAQTDTSLPIFKEEAFAT
ncbi:uncharacterized protein LOC144744085 [Ciona intestinalis]